MYWAKANRSIHTGAGQNEGEKRKILMDRKQMGGKEHDTTDKELGRGGVGKCRPGGTSAEAPGYEQPARLQGRSFQPFQPFV